MNPDTPRRHGAEASLLGQAVAYRDTYAPELLFPIERQLKRDELGIAAGALPFVGEDLWNAYEISWLDARGKPVVALGEFRVPAGSPRLIESKSLKLYLWSYRDEGIFHEHVVNAILDDLVAVLEPRWCEVTGEFAVRAGIATKVEARCDQPDNPAGTR